ncbi:MAG: PilN domain-containing protein [Gammaproteobacteria bacterium]|nr:PilN domain-containing protein [Gammaproteobacteria bacterium]
MAHINLLPWREALRKQKKQDFFAVVAIFSGIMIAVVIAAHLYMASLIDNQIARNETLKREITQIDKKIKEIKDLENQKEQLIARMRVIEELQSNRPAIVRLFDELAKIIPEGLYIDSLVQKNGSITITGQAQSNARVSAFMRALEESAWFKQPSLEVISSKSAGARKAREFTLRVSQDAPVSQDAVDGGGK